MTRDTALLRVQAWTARVLSRCQLLLSGVLCGGQGARAGSIPYHYRLATYMCAVVMLAYVAYLYLPQLIELVRATANRLF